MQCLRDGLDFSAGLLIGAPVAPQWRPSGAQLHAGACDRVIPILEVAWLPAYGHSRLGVSSNPQDLLILGEFRSLLGLPN